MLHAATEAATYFFNGMLLPKLVQLRHRLNELEGEQLMHSIPLVRSMRTGLENRFTSSSMFNFDFSVPEAKDAILAGVSHSQFKLKWVPPERRDEVMGGMLQTKLKQNKCLNTW